jgi:hypothetical protein
VKITSFRAPCNSTTIRTNVLSPCSQSKSKPRQKPSRSRWNEDGFACRKGPFKGHLVTSLGSYYLLLTPLQIISLISLVLPEYLLVFYMLFSLLTSCLFLISCSTYSWTVCIHGVRSSATSVKTTGLQNVTSQKRVCVLVILSSTSKYFGYVPGIGVAPVAVVILAVELLRNIVNLKLLKYNTQLIWITFRIRVIMVTPLHAQSICWVICGYHPFRVENMLTNTGTSSNSQYSYPKFQANRFLMADLSKTHLHFILLYAFPSGKLLTFLHKVLCRFLTFFAHAIWGVLPLFTDFL